MDAAHLGQRASRRQHWGQQGRHGHFHKRQRLPGGRDQLPQAPFLQMPNSQPQTCRPNPQRLLSAALAPCLELSALGSNFMRQQHVENSETGSAVRGHKLLPATQRRSWGAHSRHAEAAGEAGVQVQAAPAAADGPPAERIPTGVGPAAQLVAGRTVPRHRQQRVQPHPAPDMFATAHARLTQKNMNGR